MSRSGPSLAAAAMQRQQPPLRVFNVTYDLKAEHGDYKGVREEIDKHPAWCHAFQSTWWVATRDPGALVSGLQTHLHVLDRLIVTEMHRTDIQHYHDAATKNPSAECRTWLNKYLP